MDIEDAAVGGGEVLGVLECRTVLLQLVDGNGEKMTKLAILIPGGDLVFIEKTAVGKPSQTWVKKQVLAKLGLEE